MRRLKHWADRLRRDHGAAAVGVAIIHAAIAYALLSQSLVTVAPTPASISVFDIEEIPAPPLEVPEPAKKKAPRPEGAAAPPARRATPTEVVAPSPPVVPIENPVIAAPVAAIGPDPSAGAAPVDGPGTGAGGAGTGLGSGAGGTGTGAGGGRRSEWRKGRIKDSDYPDAASRARIGGTVVVEFEVGIDGRARRCQIASSSGNADLDSTTCRLIEKRFRFRPATDAQGRPVPEMVGWRQEWWLEARD